MTIKNLKVQNDFITAMKSTNTGTDPYDTVATVKRVEGSTAWVHIPGGVDETPVSLSIDAAAGDLVRVRVAGGNAWITGNNSAPPTDDTEAIAAKVNAAVAKAEADNAKKTADDAGSTATSAAASSAKAGAIASAASSSASQAAASAVNAFNTANTTNIKLNTLIRNTDDGIEVGKIPDVESLSDGESVTIPAVLVNTNGSFDVNIVTYTNSSGTITKTGSVRIAYFGKDAVIGRLLETHAHIDNNSFDIIDEDGYVRASMGGATPMFQIGKFTFINRENGNLTLRLNEE